MLLSNCPGRAALRDSCAPTLQMSKVLLVLCFFFCSCDHVARTTVQLLKYGDAFANKGA
jgi:hypothetical protein